MEFIMIKNSESKTEHILYIVTNARYENTFGDQGAFNKSLEVFRKLPSVSPISLEGEYYQADYICGMYPELEKAIRYFYGKVSPSLRKLRLIPDETLRKYATETIKKFKLKDSYDFSGEPDAYQMARLNARIFPKEKKELEKFAPELLKEMGLALINTSKDCRVVFNFMKQFDAIKRIVSGKISREEAKGFINIPGVKQGLALLELVDQGIIDKKLHILDWRTFCRSSVIRKFDVGNGKKYNLSVAMVVQKHKHKTPLGRFLSMLSGKGMSD